MEAKLHENLSVQLQALDDHHVIARFVMGEIASHKKWKTMSDGLQKDIVDALSNGSNGGLRWATLQLQQILGLDLESSIADRLQNLPTTLKDAYDEIYGRISARPDDEKKIADNALQWAMCSIEPLTTDILLEVVLLSTNPDNPMITKKNVEKTFLLDLCQGLLTYDTHGKVWTVAHQSVAEYLEEHRWCKERANAHIAKACLTLLSNTTFNGLVEDELPPKARYSLPKLHSRTPVLSNKFFSARTVGYAALYWPIHVQNHGDHDIDTQLSTVLDNFLGPPKKGSSAYKNWHKVMKELSAFMKLDGEDAKPREVLFDNVLGLSRSIGERHPWFEWDIATLSHAFLANIREDYNPSSTIVYFGFNDVLRNWWEIETFQQKFNLRTRPSLLCLAVIGPPSKGQLEVIRKLAKQGASPNSRVSYAHGKASTVLSAAVEFEREDIVALLVECGAYVDRRQHEATYPTALTLAAGIGSAKMTTQLLNSGADPNIPMSRIYSFGEYYENALTAAAAFGHDRIVSLLLNSGANPNIEGCGRYQTPLIAAASRGHTDAIRQLLDGGANINAIADTAYNPTTALTMAAEHGRTDAIRLLLHEGAHVNIPIAGAPSGLALIKAALKGTAADVKLLLEAGAEVDMLDTQGQWGSALVAAVVGSAWHGSLENGTVAALLDAGANVNLQTKSGEYACALTAAVGVLKRPIPYPDGAAAIKLLLDAGADIHMELERGPYKTPYTAAKKVAKEGEGQLDWVYKYMEAHGRGGL